jgi:hypothetical protein
VDSSWFFLQTGGFVPPQNGKGLPVWHASYIGNAEIDARRHRVRFHMYACPACNASSISFFRKWLSYPALPAHCPVCNSYSHAHQSSSGVGIVVAVFVVTPFGIAASALQAVWPLLLGIAGALAFYAWHFHKIPLERLSPELVLKAKKTERMSFIILLLSLFLN